MTICRWHLFDSLVKWGSPWHGEMVGATITLPNAQTRTAPGASQYVDGGDFFKVQVPGQPAAITTPAETADGKEWLNYGIISGANHLLYGEILGERAWLYVAPDNSIWLVKVVFPGATAAISFTPFGRMGEPVASVAQTIYITPSWTTIKSLDIIQDITPQGDKIVWSHRDDSAGSAGRASRQRQTMVDGITLLTISGTPPAAAASWTIEKTETDCLGSTTNTLLTTQTAEYKYGELYDTYPDIVEVSTIVTDTITWDWATDGPDPTPPEPTIPSGYAFASEEAAGAGLVWSEPYSANYRVILTVFSGSKSVSGAISGARFKSDGTIEYAIVNVSLDDYSTFDDAAIDISRTGNIEIAIGATTIVDYDIIATATFDNTTGSCTALRYKFGDWFDDSSTARWSHYFGGGGIAGVPNFEVSDAHIVVSSRNQYGSTYSGIRFIPARYANHCYGGMYVEGSYTWTIAPTWTESAGSVVENHQAFSANGASSVTASWSGTTTGTAATQHAWASSNPITNAVAISSSSNVCYV